MQRNLRTAHSGGPYLCPDTPLYNAHPVGTEFENQMPLFEYLCLNCNKPFDQLAKSDEVVNCPTCQKEAQKQISTTSLNTWGCSGASDPFLH